MESGFIYQKGKDKYKIDEDGNNKSLLEKG